MAWAEARDAASAMAPLGGSVGRTVAVGDADAVAVAVAVAVGCSCSRGCSCRRRCGRRRGVLLLLLHRGKNIDRPQPYTLFGGPAPPHWVEAMWTAVLFTASRLAVSWWRRLGTADQSKAIAPAMCGVAMDVPLALVYALSLALAGRARAGAGRTDVGLDPVASISCHWAAAAESKQ